MNSHEQRQGVSTLRDYLRVFRRRKWIVVGAVILLPAAALAFSLRQSSLYQGQAEVLVSRQNLAATLTGATDPTVYQQDDRVVQTQAEIASSPDVARRTLEAVGLTSRSPDDLLAASSVTAKENADLLEFTVQDKNRALAARLATAYAREYTKYRQKLDTAAIRRAMDNLTQQIRQLEARGDRSSALYANLKDKQQQLQTLEALQTSNAYVLRPAGTAEQIRPRPVRNTLLGLALGLALGLLIAFLREALDTRLRTAEDVGDVLGLPLLGRLPPPPRRLRANDRLVMLAEPNGAHAEAFRMLRTALEFANLDHSARTLMITSAVEQEGKSTTAANLAVALARAGRRVVLADFDVRRPFIARFFGIEGPGLTDVAVGRVTLDNAITPILVGSPEQDGAGSDQPRDVESGRLPGTLEVLPAGPIPPYTGEFFGTATLGHVLEELKERAEYVIIDAPPILHVGDAMALSARIDAILVVARLTLLRRPMVAELARDLDRSPATKLGFVVTGGDVEVGYGYGEYTPSQNGRLRSGIGKRFRQAGGPRGARRSKKARAS